MVVSGPSGYKVTNTLPALFPVTMIKGPGKSTSREKGFILAHRSRTLPVMAGDSRQGESEAAAPPSHPQPGCRDGELMNTLSSLRSQPGDGVTHSGQVFTPH